MTTNSKTVHFAGRKEQAKPKLEPAEIKGSITRMTAGKGKLQITIEAEVDDPEQRQAKALLDLQHGPVRVLFEEAEP
jgi:hypothetical protein